jgi:hypothetical protein
MPRKTSQDRILVQFEVCRADRDRIASHVKTVHPRLTVSAWLRFLVFSQMGVVPFPLPDARSSRLPIYSREVCETAEDFRVAPEVADALLKLRSSAKSEQVS